MTEGKVHGRHPMVPVTFVFSDKPALRIEFVVDTGFVGFLTLPLAAVEALGLPYLFDTDANLANNSEVQLPVYEATVRWNGVLRNVRVLAMGARPLLGMALLEDCDLYIRCQDADDVKIVPV